MHFGRVHFEMHETEIGLTLGWRPAARMLTLLVSGELLFVLSEVKRLARVNLVANTFHKVVVRNLLILVDVEVVENGVDLSLADRESPMFQVEKKFIFVNAAIVVLVEVFEGFTNRLPLLLDLRNNLGQHHILGHEAICCLPIVASFAALLLVDVYLIFCVFLGIVSEVETFSLMNGSTEPLAKVGVIEANPIRILHARLLTHYFK